MIKNGNKNTGIDAKETTPNMYLCLHVMKPKNPQGVNSSSVLRVSSHTKKLHKVILRDSTDTSGRSDFNRPKEISGGD